MRVHVFGGFLGAGKTTLVRALAGYLADRGERVALITNDQGKTLVDTSLCRASAGEVREIAGGCFCCRFDELEQALLAAQGAGATVALAEAVGSCTDLIATVLAPLADRHPETLHIAPLTVVVDPWRVEEFRLGRLHPDVAYLFAKQIEEADVIVTTRAERAPPDVSGLLLGLRREAAVVAVSGVTGQGLGGWLAAQPASPAPPLVIDYDRYAAAEALLGWCNARAQITGDEPFSQAIIAEKFLAAMSSAPVAHLKLTGLAPAGGRAAIVRAGDAPSVDFGDAGAVQSAEWLINARVELEPGALVEALRSALGAAASPARVAWGDVEAFRPARPVPTHRYAFRCGSGDDASCCAAFYDRADVRALLGDSWHPGGVDLTLKMADELALRPGAALLDVACGKGTSLQALLVRHHVRATGMDAQARLEEGPGLTVLRGDVHAIPFAEDTFDAILCECALSTFHDQPLALREMLRVLRPGGRIAVSDMAVEGQIPDSLRPWVHTGTCLARAMTGGAYEQMLRDAGFQILRRWDESGSLREMLRRIKKNLVGAAFAAASGSLGAGTRIDLKNARAVLREADRAVDDGAVGYTAIVAEKPR